LEDKLRLSPQIIIFAMQTTALSCITYIKVLFFLFYMKINHMKINHILLILLIPFFTYTASAQLQVQSTGYTPDQLVQDILMGTGVQSSNATFTGASSQRGYFDGTNSNIGIGSGVVLSTGDITVGIGPNDDNNATMPYDSGCGVPDEGIPPSLQGSGGLCRPGDADLDALLPINVNTQTYDAAVLEFDFIPQYDTVVFNYVFASEEYPEYVCSIFNDVFGFLISGPKPGGGNYNRQNIALIPYTALPVAINTVNPGVPGGEANGGTCAGGTGSLFFSNYYMDNSSGTTVQFDGFTVNLQAIAAFIPNETYHIKLVVADAGDGIYDSAVFLEANSFKSLPSGCALAIDDISVSGLSCHGDKDGEATVTVSGGVGDYTYQWSDGQDTRTVTNLKAGTYGVTITDAIYLSMDRWSNYSNCNES